jgi:formate dehydrogenase
MSILLLVRNFVPAHEMIERGEWQVSDIARNAFDLEGKTVGTIGAGRIGYRVLYVSSSSPATRVLIAALVSA